MEKKTTIKKEITLAGAIVQLFFICIFVILLLVRHYNGDHTWNHNKENTD